MSDTTPDPMELLSRILNGDVSPDEMEDIKAQVMGDLLEATLNPDPDMPPAITSFIESTLAPLLQQGHESEVWAQRRSELVGALRDCPPVIVEYVAYLERSTQTVAHMVAGAGMAAHTAINDTSDPPDVVAEPESPWQPGVEFRFADDNPYTCVILAVRRDIVCFAMRSPVDASYTDVFACADFVELDRDATITGRASVFSMADARAKFVEVHGEPIEVWARR